MSKPMKYSNEISTADLVKRWEECLRVLESLSPHERRKHWDMSWWGEQTECGTVACAAGHCALDPWFRRRGFKMTFVDGMAQISNVYGFFGYEGAQKIFYNGTRRPVSRVIREVKAHIKKLR